MSVIRRFKDGLLWPQWYMSYFEESAAHSISAMQYTHSPVADHITDMEQTYPTAFFSTRNEHGV